LINYIKFIYIFKKSDLEFVLEAAGTWDFVDRDKIILLGSSQGGVVSAIAAARHVDKIAGAVLLYPAFVITDAVYRQFDSLDEIPDTYSLGWITAGRVYLEDIWKNLFYFCMETRTPLSMSLILKKRLKPMKMPICL